MMQPDFNAMHSRQHVHHVQFHAFDIGTLDSDDLLRLPLSVRKTNLARLLAWALIRGTRYSISRE